MIQQKNRGLIKLLLLIIVAIIVLGYFRIDLRSIIESEAVQTNLDYAWALVVKFWDQIVIDLIWENFKGLKNRI